ncbi:unnamed protein product [Triticum turgidum subsp. durum]|uniref:BHLH domain-containing protein n=1 Tax=Triticum turgidum subsp. durum TaxID=4567 RepID=A0A9R1B3H7_TRITD|nr:unnamed protein product [Triticum turgidum subsp. durum]
MALEAVVFSKGFFGRCAMAAEGVGGGGGVWGGNEHGHGGGVELDGSNAHCGAAVASASVMIPSAEVPEGSSSLLALPPPGHGGDRGDADDGAVGAASASGAAGRRKRRRARSVKNIEEAESQRMTHIAVERNRRKQMNEYLGVLRSLMPASYVHRGDQASIIGGAINYVKELEQLVQSLEAHRHARLRDDCPVSGDVDSAAAVPFVDFFTFPQYTMSVRHAPATPAADASADGSGGNADNDGTSGSKQSAVADIEVTIVESHASLKVLSRRRPRQLLRIVAGLQGHRLAVLHLNATSAGHMALYCLSLKQVEDDCRLSSVDDIAAAVHRIVETIEREEEEEQRRRQQQQSCT